MKFVGNAGITEDSITSVEKDTGRKFPEDFLDYLRRHNGGGGFVGNRYLMLWKLEELQEFNRDYEVHEYLPDVLLFGSSGGGEAYGFRTGSVPWEVIQVPFIGMSPEECERIASSFSEFLSVLEHS
jgi:hypothetical protein